MSWVVEVALYTAQAFVVLALVSYLLWCLETFRRAASLYVVLHTPSRPDTPTAERHHAPD